jgi:flagellar biosynthesis protein FliR
VSWVVLQFLRYGNPGPSQVFVFTVTGDMLVGWFDGLFVSMLLE